ncbi:glycogen debranching protein GlgX [Labrys monachus]|uniref:4-alpha-glucanotransferase n=1 Tax=Labrys monachus TaxID=217067 RepID=A0ABU0FIZ9_9HYPH|nr:glycogen debranching protein GlgX [Labrys monachus]MDQ0394584.1 glycogen operon protein [Labrys monachus]
MTTEMTARMGAAEPLGVSWTPEGVNFAVYSADAERIELCLFAEDGGETVRITLPGRTGPVHHGLVPGLAEGRLYGLRAHGPWRPEEGLRFNPARLLLDPYATRIMRPPGTTSAMHVKGASGLDDLAFDGTDTASLMPKGVLERPLPRRARPPAPRVEPGGRIVYELHAKGFSRTHPDIPEAMRGTFAALAHPAAIRHFSDLGVTTLEVMPLAAWLDERHLEPLGLTNYWGYNPVGFFAPDPRLAPGGMAEIAATVDALHRAGFEVILDVVFNHTAESDERGQTLSLRGLDNRSYYRLADNPRFYVNDTGCGHTLALDRPVTIRLVTDALRHWAEEGGFDGFRFDLAPVLGRTARGFDAEAPLFAAIRQDPLLGSRLMIAEPWDIGPGGYRLGQFPRGWGEWNDRYRDDVRRFWRGDGGIGALATRLAGSSDLFDPAQRRPADGINFIAAHDGFTLADAVAFATKHNEANGEQNRDGHGGEISWNEGVEGASRAPEIIALRHAHCRAMLATLLLSRGTPMLSMGDELGRTQGGNNNAYAQDNATTWIDWANADTSRMQFVASLIALRKTHKLIAGDSFLTGAKGISGEPDVAWLGTDGAVLQDRDWNDPGRRSLGMSLVGADGSRVVIWFHAGGTPLQARLPDLGPGQRWRLAHVSDENQAFAPQAWYASFDMMELAPRSVGVFVAEAGPGPRRDGAAPPAMIDRLADLAGIAPEWWEVSGRHTLVSPETKRALLAAMGLPHTSLAQARESLDRLRLMRQGKVARPAGRAYLPPVLAGGGRRFGLSAQLYTLRRPGDQGVGDFTTLAELARAAAAKGAGVLALNPFHALFASDRGRTSPYQPSDRRFLDPAMIDLEAVPEVDAGAIAAVSADLPRLRAARLIDWPAVWALKRAVLSAAFAGLAAQPARQAAFEAFRLRGGEALARFAHFQALEQASGSTAFRTGPLPDGAGPDLRAEIAFACYLQFLAEEQLARAGDSGLEIGFCRDIAVGAAPDGAEVWSAPGAFLKGVTVGAPPDPFSAEGQIWNIPPLDPIALQQSDFGHYRDLLAANMRHAGALRVDHVMALTRLFVVPDGARASEGAYLRYPLEAMLAVLAEESAKARCMVVGEDLGTVPEGFRERLDEAALYSYRVLFFERDGRRFRPPEAYPARSLACVATHDLATLRGWWNGTDIELNRSLGRTLPADAVAGRQADKAALAEAVGAAGDELTPDFVGAVHGFLARAPSGLVVAQVEDLAGETDPVNLPGTDTEYPNWRRRLALDADAMLETEEAHAVFAAMKREGR